MSRRTARRQSFYARQRTHRGRWVKWPLYPYQRKIVEAMMTGEVGSVFWWGGRLPGRATLAAALRNRGSPDFLVEVCMLIYSQRTD